MTGELSLTIGLGSGFEPHPQDEVLISGPVLCEPYALNGLQRHFFPDVLVYREPIHHHRCLAGKNGTALEGTTVAWSLFADPLCLTLVEYTYLLSEDGRVMKLLPWVSLSYRERSFIMLPDYARPQKMKALPSRFSTP